MKPLFNETPLISYSFDYELHKEIMDFGDASQIKSYSNATVLVFQDVDDHIDGNGLSALWLIQGQGRFYHDGEATELKTGDVLVFDDNVEHGFESSEVCVAMNITLDKEYSMDEIKSMIQSYNVPPKKLKP